MKWLLFFLFAMVLISFISFAVIKYQESKRDSKLPWKNRLIYIGVITILILSQHAILRSLVGLHTMTAVVFNGHYKNSLPVKINGKETLIPPMQMFTFRATKFSNKIEIPVTEYPLDTIVGSGFFALSNGPDFYLKLIERNVKLLNEKSKERNLFFGFVDNSIIKLDDKSDAVYIHPLNREIPRFFKTTSKTRGKRVFTTEMTNK